MAFLDQDGLSVVLSSLKTKLTELYNTLYAAKSHNHSYTDLTDKPTIDTALSNTSTNAVQNKVVKAALDGKASSSHSHSYVPLTDVKLNRAAPGTSVYGRYLELTNTAGDKYYIGIDEFGKLWGGQAINNASSITWYPAIMNNHNNGAVSITASSFEINNASLDVNSNIIWAPWLNLRSGNTMYFYPNGQTELYAWLDKGSTGIRFCPHLDGRSALGLSNYRWNSIYSTQGIITTSDKRRKKDISDDIAIYKDILSEITPVKYRYNDIEDDKIRIGFIAQELDALFEKHGLNPRDFAAIRLDEIEPTETIPDGKVYGISYDGFVALNTALIQDLQKENTELKDKLAAMEERLARLEEKIGS